MSTIVLDTIQDRVSSVSVPASDLRGIWQQIGATQIASSDAAIIFQDGVSYTLPGTWDRLKVVCKNVVAAVSADELYLTYYQGGSRVTSGYLWQAAAGYSHLDAVSGICSSVTGNGDGFWLTYNAINTATVPTEIDAVIMYPAATGFKWVKWDGLYLTSTSNVGWWTGGGLMGAPATTAPIDGVHLACSTGNITSGEFTLYGMYE